MIRATTPLPVDDSQRAYARLAGLLYLVVLALDIAGLVTTSTIRGSGTFVETSQRIAASEGLYRLGLCTSLVGSLATVVLAVGLYVAVRPVEPDLAMTGLLFRVAEAVIGAVGILFSFAVLQLRLAATSPGAFGAGQLSALADLSPGAATEISLIFFSCGSAIFFYLFLRSRYLPRVVAGWGIFASVVYAVFGFGTLVMPQLPSAVIALALLPILIAEVSTGFWLLVRGLKGRPTT